MEERIRKIWESRYGKEVGEPIAVLLENINGTLGKKEDEEKKRFEMRGEGSKHCGNVWTILMKSFLVQREK